VHWDRIIDVNLRGVIQGWQPAYPLMLGQGHGQILNVASRPVWSPAWGLPIPPSVACSPTLREYLVNAGVRIYPADRLAEDTLRVLERNKAVLVIPSEWHRTWLLFRLVPGLVESKMVAMTGAGPKAVEQRAPAGEAKQSA
jgi:NAD(P)-dependent dehydrogenase (short-subunit alcohol dehydrogenase family)